MGNKILFRDISIDPWSLAPQIMSLGSSNSTQRFTMKRGKSLSSLLCKGIGTYYNAIDNL